ncbi:MAG: DegT/DnrJ/EryC1/StrS family aminotransferase [SAR86 cluster bacterium]|nr:DegT/DnrJ/EryC1/StrS family aminotransferase [SAR86 cluster bacterium]
MKSKLALFGGSKIIKKQIKNKPYIEEKDIKLVGKLMEQGRFSRFVGSPIPGTMEELDKKSKDLVMDLKDDRYTFLGGAYVRSFEAKNANLVNADYAISVNSATSGLVTSLLALDLPNKSKVITTPYSFSATAAAIRLANLQPVFCDIDIETFNICPEDLKKTIKSKNIKCVVYVHWCGNAGDFDEIVKICKKNNIYLIEDSAQAPISLYKKRYLGTYGDMGVFSFNEPKNFMTGEGGMIVTNNKKFAVRSRLIRNHGEAIIDESFKKDLTNNTFGHNFRLTEIQAAIGLNQLKKSKKLSSIRSSNYKYLLKMIMSLNSDFIKPQRITHLESFYSYTAAFRWDSALSGIHRDTFCDALIKEGAPVFTGYPKLMSEQTLHKKYSNTKNTKNAQRLNNDEFFGFLCLGNPNGKSEMKLIYQCIEKVLLNIDQLKEVKLKNKSISLGR